MSDTSVAESLSAELKQLKHTNEETTKVVDEQKSIIENLTQKVSELETSNRRTIEQLTDEKRKLRNTYEYELGMMTGMNEAIMNQNDQMRMRILEQNQKLKELHERELLSKELLFQMEERLATQ